MSTGLYVFIDKQDSFMKLSFSAVTSGFGLLVITSISMSAFAVHVDMAPGLWEQSYKLDNSAANAAQQGNIAKMQKRMEEMKQQLAKMPPEQRKIVEGMLAQQNMRVTDDGIAHKVCISLEEIKRGELPKPEENCENNVTQTSPKTFKITYSCKGRTQSQGVNEITFQNSKSFTGKINAVMNMNNKPEAIHGEMSGQWLSSDCGAIKPRAQDEESQTEESEAE